MLDLDEIQRIFWFLINDEYGHDFCEDFRRDFVLVNKSVLKYVSRDDESVLGVFHDDITLPLVQQALHKSLFDGHDYVLDLVAKPENIPPKYGLDCD